MSDKRISLAEYLFKTEGPILQTKAMKSHGFCSKDINDLMSNGFITKIKTGYYCWSASLPELSDDFIAVSVVSNAVLCLYSAAKNHELTTVIPEAVYLSVPNRGVLPQLPLFPPVRLFRQIEPLYSLGIQNEKTDHGIIRIYDRERTVCDFFRSKETMGTDIAIEVLKTYMHGTKHMQTLLDYAAVLGIQQTIRPYVEALL